MCERGMGQFHLAIRDVETKRDDFSLPIFLCQGKKRASQTSLSLGSGARSRTWKWISTDKSDEREAINHAWKKPTRSSLANGKCRSPKREIGNSDFHCGFAEHSTFRRSFLPFFLSLNLSFFSVRFVKMRLFCRSKINIAEKAAQTIIRWPAFLRFNACSILLSLFLWCLQLSQKSRFLCKSKRMQNFFARFN